MSNETLAKIVVTVGATLVAVTLVVFLSFLLAWPVRELWNGCLVDAVDGLHEITWMQAWGISVLTGILFKSSMTTNNDKK